MPFIIIVKKYKIILLINIMFIIIMLVLNFDNNSKLQGFPINHSGMHAIDVPYTQCVFSDGTDKVSMFLFMI